MSPLVRLDPALHRCLTRRFGVSQVSSAGEKKLRCIDDFAASGINNTTSIKARIRMGRLSSLVETTRQLHSFWPSSSIRLAKSDFSAAYRMCPILGRHLEFSSVLVEDKEGGLWTSTQWVMPFGAVSAVYAWDRLGGAVSRILRKLLLLPLDRYVDDLFWSDHSAISLATLAGGWRSAAFLRYLSRRDIDARVALELSELHSGSD